MSPVVVTPPAAIVSLAEAKAHLDISSSDSDTYISAIVDAATTVVAELTGRALAAATYDLSFDAEDVTCRTEIPLPLPPLREVVSVTYNDADGAAQTWAASNYRVRGVMAGSGGALALAPDATWPTMETAPEAFTIRFIAGYDTTPAPIKHAILLTIGHMWSLGGERPLIRGESVEGVGTRDWSSPEVIGQAMTVAVERLLMPYRVYAI